VAVPPPVSDAAVVTPGIPLGVRRPVLSAPPVVTSEPVLTPVPVLAPVPVLSPTVVELTPLAPVGNVVSTVIDVGGAITGGEEIAEPVAVSV
jgi:hypothetical protein